MPVFIPRIAGRSVLIRSTKHFLNVAGLKGIEPSCPDRRVRTYDLLLPKQAHYQAVLMSDGAFGWTLTTDLSVPIDRVFFL